MKTTIIQKSQLDKCPMMILAASHWLPKHKVSECGAKKRKHEKKKPKVVECCDTFRCPHEWDE